MLNNNAYAFIWGLLSKNSIGVSVTKPDGTAAKISVWYDSFANKNNAHAFDKIQVGYGKSAGVPTEWGLYFGNGDTEPSVTDYSLAGDLLSIYGTGGTVTLSQTQTGDLLEFRATLPVQNVGSDTATIKEIGFFANLDVVGWSLQPILIDRTVLDTPITLAPQEIKDIIYIMRFSYSGT